MPPAPDSARSVVNKSKQAKQKRPPEGSLFETIFQSYLIPSLAFTKGRILSLSFAKSSMPPLASKI
jgi:hypothetical protein